DIRNASQPRYHLEMTLLRWIHLRKLMPIEELIASAGSGGALPRPPAAPPLRSVASQTPTPSRSVVSAPTAPKPQAASAAPAATAPRPTPMATSPAPEPTGDSSLKDAFLSEVRRSNAVLYNTVVVQAQRIEVKGDRIVLTYTAAQKIGPTFD